MDRQTDRYISDRDNLTSCTSSGCVLQLCKVSSESVQPLRRSCDYKTYGQTDRVIPINPPKKLVCGGYKYCKSLYMKIYLFKMAKTLLKKREIAHHVSVSGKVINPYHTSKPKLCALLTLQINSYHLYGSQSLFYTHRRTPGLSGLLHLAYSELHSDLVSIL